MKPPLDRSGWGRKGFDTPRRYRKRFHKLVPKIPIGVLLSSVPDGLDPALALAKELHATSLTPPILPSKQSAANVFA